MTTVLVAHAGKNGGTGEIAQAIGTELRAMDLRVEVRAAADVTGVGSYGAVVLGSALYFHRWRPEAVRLLADHVDALFARPVWLFHSGPCGPDSAGVRVSLPANVALLAARVDAERTETFGGRLDPATARGVLPRLMATGPRAGDFRDWERIRCWARDIGRQVGISVSH